MFSKVVFGGTFDHFHKGHKDLLEFAISVSDEVVVGITSEIYVSKIKSRGGSFEGYKTREMAVLNFLKTCGPRFEIVEIDDVFGKTLQSDFDAQAIIITVETHKGAEIINDARKKAGLAELEILICPLTIGEDGKSITSERIRSGEIDREGKLYINPLWLKKEKYITDEVRRELKNPFGKLIVSPEKEDFENVTGVLASVGDESTKFLKSLLIRPAISVVDFKVARKKKFSRLSDLGFTGSEEVTRVKNEPGTLSPELFKAVSYISRRGKDQESVVLIDGEDDLAVIPLLLALPLGSCVFYGQPARLASESVVGRPEEGIVKISVSEENKKRAYDIVSRFNTRGH